MSTLRDLLRQLRVLYVGTLPADLVDALELLPGTLVALSCWTPAGDEVQVTGYRGDGTGYTHVGQADGVTWMAYVSWHPLLHDMPLGASDQEAEAQLVIDCRSGDAWVAHQSVLGPSFTPAVAAMWAPTAIKH